ncbi:MAG: hypothetical protein H7122_16140 [Chitinophagaceae bacterium]|nr:hypothetical protein [Chitinophagaceae bacterium]
MTQNLTWSAYWSAYWSAILIILLTYYAVIILLYCKEDLKNIILKTSHIKYRPTSEHNSQTSQQQAAMDEIRAYLLQSSYYPIGKSDFVSGLQGILSKYKNLQNTAYETSINKLALQECDHDPS